MTESTKEHSVRDTASADPVTTSGDTVTATVTAAAAGSYAVVANVNVRSGPGTQYAKVGTLSAGSRVSIICQAVGENITGPLGTSRLWDRIDSGRYVSDTYVDTGSDSYVAPQC